VAPDHFERTFTRLIAPQLATLGFRMVRPPKGWIAPNKLYERNNQWFGAEWDWQDNYLQVALGRLYRFQDVLPRVVVRGPYAYSAMGERETPDAFLAVHLTRVARELQEAVEHLEERLPASLTEERARWEGSSGDGKSRYAEFLSRVGGELTRIQWTGSQVV